MARPDRPERSDRPEHDPSRPTVEPARARKAPVATAAEAPRLIPATKGREAAARGSTDPARDTRRRTRKRERPVAAPTPPPPRSGAATAPPSPVPAARRTGLPISILIPINVLLLALVAIVPSLLLYMRIAGLEEELARREIETGARENDLVDRFSDRMDALETFVRDRGPISEDLEAEEVAMLERAGRAVIHIEQTRYVRDGAQRFTVKKAGSGFIFDPEGYALTNFHVIDGYDELKAYLHNGEEVEVKVIGKDPPSDIALLRLVGLDRVEGAESIEALEMGTSAELAFGQYVYALGSPKNLKFSTARGIVSNPRRYQPTLMLHTSGLNTGLFNNWIQTDAAINKGNSGGALVDVRGRVVGVVSRKLSEAENIGFAIPVDDVKRLLPSLRRDGFVRRSMIGVVLSGYKPEEGFLEGGVRVRVVLRGSPADRAGVRAGDVLNKIGEVELPAAADDELPEAYHRIAQADAGSPVSLRITRSRTPMVLSITPRLREEIDDKFIFMDLLGCAVAPVDPALRRLFGVTSTNGLWVGAVEADGRFARAGIEVGDVLIKASGNEASKVVVLQKINEQIMRRQVNRLDIEIQRNGTVLSKTLQFHFVEED